MKIATACFRSGWYFIISLTRRSIKVIVVTEWFAFGREIHILMQEKKRRHTSGDSRLFLSKWAKAVQLDSSSQNWVHSTKEGTSKRVSITFASHSCLQDSQYVSWLRRPWKWKQTDGTSRTEKERDIRDYQQSVTHEHNWSPDICIMWRGLSSVFRCINSFWVLNSNFWFCHPDHHRHWKTSSIPVKNDIYSASGFHVDFDWISISLLL